MTDEWIGKTINGYEYLEVIGRGGMATVYRAHQISMNRIVAVKVLPKQYIHDDTYLQRFEQEVKIVSQLEHRNIVPVHDYGEYEGQPYIVMRYMPSGSVDDLLNRGPLDLEQIVSILEQIAPALDYAHSKHVLHRDLKPSNVLLDEAGGAYLTDFGIARILSEGIGKGITTQGVVGTPSYMSPEQAQGLPLDNRSDVYALGVMLFEMATGRRPFESDTPYGVAVMQVTTQPPSPRSYNPALSFAAEEVILKALKKKREERYPHAVALSEALKRALDKPVTSIHDTQPALLRPPPRPAVPIQSVPPALPASQLSSAYAPAASPSAAAGLGAVPVAYPRRRRKPRTNAWLNAALGGAIGCGVLAVLVILALFILANLLSSSEPPPTASPPPVNDSRPALMPPDTANQTARQAPAAAPSSGMTGNSAALIPLMLEVVVPQRTFTVCVAGLSVRSTRSLARLLTRSTSVRDGRVIASSRSTLAPIQMVMLRSRSVAESRSWASSVASSTFPSTGSVGRFSTARLTLRRIVPTVG